MAEEADVLAHLIETIKGMAAKEKARSRRLRRHLTTLEKLTKDFEAIQIEVAERAISFQHLRDVL